MRDRGADGGDGDVASRALHPDRQGPGETLVGAHLNAVRVDGRERPHERECGRAALALGRNRADPVEDEGEAVLSGLREVADGVAQDRVRDPRVVPHGGAVGNRVDRGAGAGTGEEGEVARDALHRGGRSLQGLEAAEFRARAHQDLREVRALRGERPLELAPERHEVPVVDDGVHPLHVVEDVAVALAVRKGVHVGVRLVLVVRAGDGERVRGVAAELGRLRAEGVLQLPGDAVDVRLVEPVAEEEVADARKRAFGRDAAADAADRGGEVVGEEAEVLPDADGDLVRHYRGRTLRGRLAVADVRVDAAAGLRVALLEGAEGPVRVGRGHRAVRRGPERPGDLVAARGNGRRESLDAVSLVRRELPRVVPGDGERDADRLAALGENGRFDLVRDVPDGALVRASVGIREDRVRAGGGDLRSARGERIEDAGESAAGDGGLGEEPVAAERLVGERGEERRPLARRAEAVGDEGELRSVEEPVAARRHAALVGEDDGRRGDGADAGDAERVDRAVLADGGEGLADAGGLVRVPLAVLGDEVLRGGDEVAVGPAADAKRLGRGHADVAVLRAREVEGVRERTPDGSLGVALGEVVALDERGVADPEVVEARGVDRLAAGGRPRGRGHVVAADAEAGLEDPRHDALVAALVLVLGLAGAVHLVAGDGIPGTGGPELVCKHSRGLLVGVPVRPVGVAAEGGRELHLVLGLRVGGLERLAGRVAGAEEDEGERGRVTGHELVVVDDRELGHHGDDALEEGCRLPRGRGRRGPAAVAHGRDAGVGVRVAGIADRDALELPALGVDERRRLGGIPADAQALDVDLGETLVVGLAAGAVVAAGRADDHGKLLRREVAVGRDRREGVDVDDAPERLRVHRAAVGDVGDGVHAAERGHGADRGDDLGGGPVLHRALVVEDGDGRVEVAELAVRVDGDRAGGGHLGEGADDLPLDGDDLLRVVLAEGVRAEVPCALPVGDHAERGVLDVAVRDGQDVARGKVKVREVVEGLAVLALAGLLEALDEPAVDLGEVRLPQGLGLLLRHLSGADHLVQDGAHACHDGVALLGGEEGP